MPVALELSSHQKGSLVTRCSEPIQLPNMPTTQSNRQGCQPHTMIIKCQGCDPMHTAALLVRRIC